MSLRRKTKPEKAAVMLVPPSVRPVGNFRMATAADIARGAAAREKDSPQYSEAWRRAVASIPACVRCGRQMVSEDSGELGTQAAHRNEGKGMGMKVDDCLTAGICPACHTEIDQGKDMTKEQRRREIDVAIIKTLVWLFRTGRVKVIT